MTTPESTPMTVRERLLLGDSPFSMTEEKAIAAFGGVPVEKVRQIVHMTTQAVREGLDVR